MSNEMQVERRFVELVSGRNFVTFAELEEQLGLSQSQLIWLKGNLEDVLRLHVGDEVFLTSRMDLNPPGFEIGE